LINQMAYDRFRNQLAQARIGAESNLSRIALHWQDELARLETEKIAHTRLLWQQYIDFLLIERSFDRHMRAECDAC